MTYRDIAESLKSEIFSGRYNNARALPSVSSLARKFAVARATVHHALTTPQLTTIRQSRDKMGGAAFKRLLERIENPDLPANEILFPAQLVVRDSTKRTKGKKKK